MDKKIIVVFGIICIAIIVTFLIVKGNKNSNDTKLSDEEEVITEYKKLSCTESGNGDYVEKLEAYSFENKKLANVFRIITYKSVEDAKAADNCSNIHNYGVECTLSGDRIEYTFNIKVLSNDTKTKFDIIDKYYDDYDALKKYLTNEKGLKCED